MPVKEDQLERVMEELEMRCWDKIQTIVKTEESLGIEFDENVICDVCRSVCNLLINLNMKIVVNLLIQYTFYFISILH